MGKWDDLITLFGAMSPAARPMSGIINARRSIPTAEFNPLTGEVDARGLRFLDHGIGRAMSGEAMENGRRVLARHNAGEIDGLYSSLSGAAYPVGDRDTRRHEMFHGMVDMARLHGDRISPTVDAMAAVGKLFGDTGASRIAEELIAHGVGRQRRLSLSEAIGIARAYAPTYRRQGGLMHALPAYAIGYAPEAAGFAAATGIPVAYAAYSKDKANDTAPVADAVAAFSQSPARPEDLIRSLRNGQ